MVFVDRRALRDAICGARRGKDEITNLTALHRIQEIQTAQQIRLVVQRRVLRGFANQRLPGEMENAVDRMFGEGSCEIFRIAEIPLERRNALSERSMACREIVENERLKSCRFQRLDRMASDIAGAAGEENHRCSFRQ